jgi:hypothetical protein
MGCKSLLVQRRRGLYTVLIRVDETLPWIELKGEYETRKEAQRAAAEAVEKIVVMVVNVPQERRPLKALAIMRERR